MMTDEQKIKLRVYPKLQEDIQTHTKLFPFTNPYFAAIAEELGCRVEEMIGIAPIERGNCGFDIWTFFPADKPILIKRSNISPIYHGERGDMYDFGDIEIVVISGIKFVAERSIMTLEGEYEPAASEYTIYANPRNVEPLETSEDESQD